MRRYLMGFAGLFAVQDAAAGPAFDLLGRQSVTAQCRAFAQVIRGAGEACDAVTRLAYLGESATADAGFWTARCEAADFIVAVSNSAAMGTTVLSCGKAEAMGVDCWKPFR